jgi:hypothetical protein
MAKIGDMPGDVYFGSPDKPLPNWREHIDANEPDDIDEFTPLSPEARERLAAKLGISPDDEIFDEPDPGEPTSLYSGDGEIHEQGDIHS